MYATPFTCLTSSYWIYNKLVQFSTKSSTLHLWRQSHDSRFIWRLASQQVKSIWNAYILGISNRDTYFGVDLNTWKRCSVNGNIAPTSTVHSSYNNIPLFILGPMSHDIPIFHKEYPAERLNRHQYLRRIFAQWMFTNGNLKIDMLKLIKLYVDLQVDCC